MLGLPMFAEASHNSNLYCTYEREMKTINDLKYKKETNLHNKQSYNERLKHKLKEVLGEKNQYCSII